MKKLMVALGAAVTVACALTAPAYAAGAGLRGGAEAQATTTPGAAFDATFTTWNSATAVVHGASLVVLTTSYGVQAGPSAGNCFYQADGRLSACVFDQDLAPGAKYQVALPFKARTDTYAPGGLSGQFTWQASATPNSSWGTRGTGAPLELRPVDAPDTTFGDSGFQGLDVDVTGSQGTDLVATGATINGATGDVVDATVGVRNNGPATLDFTMSHFAVATVIITPPTGTTVASVPAGCEPAGPDLRTRTDVKQYACDSDVQMRVGQARSWTFPLRLTAPVIGAKGSIEVNPPCSCQRFAKDLDTSNNVAPITIAASSTATPTPSATVSSSTPASTSASPSASISASVSVPTGGTGSASPSETAVAAIPTVSTTPVASVGGLPLTGPGVAVAGGAGVLLIGAGVGGFLLTRRRRTRFQA